MRAGASLYAARPPCVESLSLGCGARATCFQTDEVLLSYEGATISSRSACHSAPSQKTDAGPSNTSGYSAKSARKKKPNKQKNVSVNHPLVMSQREQRRVFILEKKASSFMPACL